MTHRPFACEGSVETNCDTRLFNTKMNSKVEINNGWTKDRLKKRKKHHKKNKKPNQLIKCFLVWKDNEPQQH